MRPSPDANTPAGGWRGELSLRYRRDGDRCVAHDKHIGPLRVLQPLYPEGPAICHHVIVHPPGGVVGGDELLIDARLDAGSHALITTPGATRFYRSDGAVALQRAQVHVAADARLEWLPMEAIAYSGCRAHNQLHLSLAPGAEMLGWDVLALGLPAARAPFVDGWFAQHLELPGVWLERGRVAASDATLLQSPLGWAGHSVLATLWFAQGTPLATGRRDALLEAARPVSPPPKARSWCCACWRRRSSQRCSCWPTCGQPGVNWPGACTRSHHASGARN
jgi:urease accessory protein